MVRCEYNQRCETAKKYFSKLVELNKARKFKEKSELWELLTNKCSRDYESCPERKKFMEAED